jgi:PAS domain S-box-containing protein
MKADLDSSQPMAQIGAVFLDAELCIQWFTPYGAHALGLSPEHRGQPLASLLGDVGPSPSGLLDAITQTLQSETARQWEVPIHDDEVLLVQVEPSRETSGVIDGIVLLLTLYPPLPAQPFCQRVQRLLEVLMDNIPDSIYFKDESSRFLRANQALAARLGLDDPDAVIGKTDFEFFAEEHALAAYSDEQAILDSGQPIVNKIEKETWPDRRERWVSTTKVPWRDEQGKIAGTLGISRDITDQRLADEHLRLAIESSPDAIFLIGEDGVIVSANIQAEVLSGYPRGELLAKSISSLFAQCSQSEWEWLPSRVFTEAASRIIGTGADVFLVRREGAEVPVEIGVNCVETGEGRLTVCTVRDISERQEIRSALTRKAQELQRINHELQQFVYVASHDLREPLRTINGFCTLLKQNYQECLDSQADYWIGFITDGVQRMQSLIDDLLAYSRIDSRAKPPEMTDFNRVVDQVLESLQLLIEETDAEIACGPLPTLSAEPSQAIQLLQNLISNAIKYRSDEPPEIRISSEMREHEWVFAVRDNGIGIDPKHDERIFEVFKRLHSRDEYPGTGIGLAICRKIVGRHGGRIWVESESGAGATFYFTIPISAKRNDESY